MEQGRGRCSHAGCATLSCVRAQAACFQFPAAEIGIAVGAVIDKHKMRKHFNLAITDDSFTFTRAADAIAAEAATDGLYVIRTSLAKEALGDAETVRGYKSLALVERAFRCIKTVDLQVRPVRHWLAGRVRAHVFLCMLVSRFGSSSSFGSAAYELPNRQGH